jgi:hypothetical protein
MNTVFIRLAMSSSLSSLNTHLKLAGPFYIGGDEFAIMVDSSNLTAMIFIARRLAPTRNASPPATTTTYSSPTVRRQTSPATRSIPSSTARTTSFCGRSGSSTGSGVPVDRRPSVPTALKTFVLLISGCWASRLTSNRQLPLGQGPVHIWSLSPRSQVSGLAVNPLAAMSVSMSPIRSGPYAWSQSTTNGGVAFENGIGQEQGRISRVDDA